MEGAVRRGRVESTTPRSTGDPPDAPHPWFRTSAGVAITCHHGQSGPGAPPGSLAAYLAAYDLGYRWFQVDVVPVRDDIVSLHAIIGRRIGLTGLSVTEVRARLGYDVPTLRDLLEHPGLRDARWNIEVKSRRCVPVLLRTLRQTRAVSRVMISAPYHPSTLRDVRDGFGALVAIAAPVIDGGAFGVPLRRPRRLHDAFQVHHRLSRRARRRAIGFGAPVQAWTIGDDARMDGCLACGCAPIVAHPDAATRDRLQRSGHWGIPDTTRHAEPVESIPPLQGPVREDVPIEALLLGGGGWRGAFGSIGAVMYLLDTGRWVHVRQVVAISGGGFVAAQLGTHGVNDDDPAAALAGLFERLVAVRGPMRRATLVGGAIGLFLIVPPIGLQLERWYLTIRWRLLLGRLYHGCFPRPIGSGGRRFVIGAAGRSSGVPHFFVSGGEKTLDQLKDELPGWGVVVGDGWSCADAVRSTTALPFVNGYRTPDSPGIDGPGVGRGEVLIDGGVTGIFGRQYLDRQPWLTSTADAPRCLVLDAGRSLKRSRRVIDRMVAISGVMLLTRWVQIALETGFRSAVNEASRVELASTTTPMVHLARIAETDEAGHHSTLGEHDEVVRRLEHGRRHVARFGLLGISRERALMATLVAVVACAVDVEPAEQRGVEAIEARLRRIGDRLGPGYADDLARVWDQL